MGRPSKKRREELVRNMVARMKGEVEQEQEDYWRLWNTQVYVLNGVFVGYTLETLIDYQYNHRYGWGAKRGYYSPVTILGTCTRRSRAKQLADRLYWRIDKLGYLPDDVWRKLPL